MATPALYPGNLLYPSSTLYPSEGSPNIDYGPGGGGFGALMGRRHFERYEVDGKWRNVKRVKIPTGGKK